jgi:hypothetical protein
MRDPRTKRTWRKPRGLDCESCSASLGLRAGRTVAQLERRHSAVGLAALELYDLATDRGEARDVAASHPEIVEQIVSIAKKAHTPSQLWPDRNPKAEARRAA